MEDPCSWFECDREVYARSVCKKHYNCLRKLIKKGVRTDEELVIGGYFDAHGYQQVDLHPTYTEPEAEVS
jgi:hypothetical protein